MLNFVINTEYKVEIETILKLSDREKNTRLYREQLLKTNFVRKTVIVKLLN